MGLEMAKKGVTTAEAGMAVTGEGRNKTAKAKSTPQKNLGKASKFQARSNGHAQCPPAPGWKGSS